MRRHGRESNEVKFAVYGRVAHAVIIVLLTYRWCYVLFKLNSTVYLEKEYSLDL